MISLVKMPYDSLTKTKKSKAVDAQSPNGCITFKGGKDTRGPFTDIMGKTNEQISPGTPTITVAKKTLTESRSEGSNLDCKDEHCNNAASSAIVQDGRADIKCLTPYECCKRFILHASHGHVIVRLATIATVWPCEAALEILSACDGAVIVEVDVLCGPRSCTCQA